MKDTEQNLDDNVGPDGFVIAPDHPRAQAHRMLSQLERERLTVKREVQTAELATEKAALQVDSQMAVDLMVAIQERKSWLLKAWGSIPSAVPVGMTLTKPLSNYEFYQLTTLLLDLSRALANQKTDIP